MTGVAIAAPDDMLRAVRQVVAGADEALLCVAFANQAGVELLAPALRGRSGRVRLLATTVFGDTTSAALGRANDLGVEVRERRRAHPRGGVDRDRTQRPTRARCRAGAGLDAQRRLGSPGRQRPPSPTATCWPRMA